MRVLEGAASVVRVAGWLRAELLGPENDESPRCRSTGGFAGGGFGQPSISMSRNTITPITTNAVMSVVLRDDVG